MSVKYGEVCWNELMTHDLEGAKAFYAATLGWKFTGNEMPMGFTYWLATVNDVPVAGFMDMSGMEHMKDVPSFWMTYIAVQDVDAVAKASATAGGQVLNGPFDVPTVGRIAIVQDASGAQIGFMTPALA